MAMLWRILGAVVTLTAPGVKPAEVAEQAMTPPVESTLETTWLVATPPVEESTVTSPVLISPKAVEPTPNVTETGELTRLSYASNICAVNIASEGSELEMVVGLAVKVILFAAAALTTIPVWDPVIVAVVVSVAVTLCVPFVFKVTPPVKTLTPASPTTKV